MSNTKKLNLQIYLKDAHLPKEEKDSSPIELSSRVIRNIMLSYSQKTIGFRGQTRGFDKLERKQYWIISDVLDKAVKEKQAEVELDDKLIGFIDILAWVGIIYSMCGFALVMWYNWKNYSRWRKYHY